MRPTASALLAILALGLGAAGLAGCGDSSRLLPGAEASRLDDQLQQTADRTLAGDCPGALASLQQAQRTFASLPASVDVRLRARIQEGLGGLARSVPAQCADAANPDIPGTPTTTPSTTTTTDTTTPTTTTDTTTTTTPTTTPTTTTTTTTTPAPPVGGVSPEAGPGTTP